VALLRWWWAIAYPAESFARNINFLVSVSEKQTFGEILFFCYIFILFKVTFCRSPQNILLDWQLEAFFYGLMCKLGYVEQPRKSFVTEQTRPIDVPWQMWRIIDITDYASVALEANRYMRFTVSRIFVTVASSIDSLGGAVRKLSNKRSSIPLGRK